ncbi:MAG: DUF5667 domain-containing protein [Anaerolineae bacterium]
MTREIEEALNECVERMPADESAVDAIVAAHPEHAGELTSLVQLAQAIRELPRPEPPIEALAEIQAQVVRVARAKRATEQTRPTRSIRLPVPGWWTGRLVGRVAQAAVIVLMAVVLSMGSVTVSAESLPGSPLYSVKRAAEQVQLRITFDPQQRAALRLTFAERRANEIVALAHRGQPVDQITLAVMLEETGIAIRELQNLSPDAARALLTRAQNVLEYQQICLVHIRPDAPKAALAAIDQAIQICQQRARLIQQMQNELNVNMQTR